MAKMTSATGPAPGDIAERFARGRLLGVEAKRDSCPWGLESPLSVSSRTAGAARPVAALSIGRSVGARDVVLAGAGMRAEVP
jgi:hypothetical protein